MAETKPYEHYYVPASSHWPIIASLGLGSLMLGFANLLHDRSIGHYFFFFGALCIIYMMYGWFSDVVKESRQGLYSHQMDHSFRFSMGWFIFSEVMFFAAFFGVLFYVRVLGLPWLAGEGHQSETHALLWPQFKYTWPLLINPDPKAFPGAIDAMHAWWIPSLNTFLLLISSVTITWAHWGLIKNNRQQLIIGMFATVALGLTFLGFQVYEYYLAFTHYGLTLGAGIYGSTFFMLTGFHGAHVTVGSIMLIIILIRCLKGHFSPQHHFAFEAVAWYWHFVDVVWLFLFTFVYCL